MPPPTLALAAALVCALLGVSLALPVHASVTEGALDGDAAVRTSQEAIGRRIEDRTLLDRNGKPVRLSSYRGKPLLVSFVYTGCFEVCPTGTRALHEAVSALETRFGTGQFNVASIGFNQPSDSPTAMKAFAAQNGIDFRTGRSEPAAGEAMP